MEQYHGEPFVVLFGTREYECEAQFDSSNQCLVLDIEEELILLYDDDNIVFLCDHYEVRING